jgi:Domain of unknown function (DUF6471)
VQAPPDGYTLLAFDADLADKLAAVGVKDNERNISNKIRRGTFTAVFFVQCMEAIGCRTIHLDEP